MTETETFNESRIKGTVWLSGQLGTDMSLREVLEMIGTMTDAKFAVLRILSKSGRGYIGIQGTDTITGAHVTSSREGGTAALKRLFSTQKGMFVIMTMDELPIELAQDMGLSIKSLLEKETLWDGLSDFESYMAWGEDTKEAAPKLSLNKITTKMAAPKAEEVAASRAAAFGSIEEALEAMQDPQFAAAKQPAIEAEQPSVEEEEKKVEVPATEPETTAGPKVWRRGDGVYRDDQQSMSQKIRALRDEEAHKLAPLEDYFDDAPAQQAAPNSGRKVTVMSFVYGGVGLLLLLALGNQVFNITQGHAQFRSGLKSLANGDSARAQVEMTTALKLGAKGTDPYLYRSIAEDRLGHAEKAMSDLNQLISHNGGDHVARISRATMLLKNKDYTNAINDCDAILKQEPSYLDAYRVKAIAECGAGDYKLCIDDARTYLEASEEKPHLERARSEVFATRAFAYLKVKKYDQAVADYSSAIELNSKNPHLYASRAVAYTKIKQWQAGLNDVDAAIKLDASNSALYKLRGICYREAGKLDLAALDLNTAAKMKPSLNAFRLRGEARLAAKDYVGALEDFEYLLSVNPNDKEAKQKFDAARLALVKPPESAKPQ